jgi:uncharacterized membrane protein YkoI
MKRNLVIAAVTAAALAGGGTYTAAVAMTGDNNTSAAAPAPAAPIAVGEGSVDDSPADDAVDDTADDTADDGGATGAAPPAARSGKDLTAGEAAAAALKKYPGAVSSVERDDDRVSHFEIDLFGKDNRRHDLNVDMSTGRVTADRDDDDDDRDDSGERAALRAATLDVQEAAAAALRSVPGTVTSAEIDDDRSADSGRWEVGVRGRDGRTHELTVHAKSGKVTAAPDDDRHGSRHDDAHDTDDNHDDDVSQDDNGSDD